MKNTIITEINRTLEIMKIDSNLLNEAQLIPRLTHWLDELLVPGKIVIRNGQSYVNNKLVTPEVLNYLRFRLPNVSGHSSLQPMSRNLANQFSNLIPDDILQNEMDIFYKDFIERVYRGNNNLNTELEIIRDMRRQYQTDDEILDFLVRNFSNNPILGELQANILTKKIKNKMGNLDANNFKSELPNREQFLLRSVKRTREITRSMEDWDMLERFINSNYTLFNLFRREVQKYTIRITSTLTGIERFSDEIVNDMNLMINQLINNQTRPEFHRTLSLKLRRYNEMIQKSADDSEKEMNQILDNFLAENPNKEELKKQFIEITKENSPFLKGFFESSMAGRELNKTSSAEFYRLLGNFRVVRLLHLGLIKKGNKKFIEAMRELIERVVGAMILGAPKTWKEIQTQFLQESRRGRLVFVGLILLAHNVGTPLVLLAYTFFTNLLVNFLLWGTKYETLTGAFLDPLDKVWLSKYKDESGNFTIKSVTIGIFKVWSLGSDFVSFVRDVNAHKVYMINMLAMIFGKMWKGLNKFYEQIEKITKDPKDNQLIEKFISDSTLNINPLVTPNQSNTKSSPNFSPKSGTPKTKPNF